MERPHFEHLGRATAPEPFTLRTLDAPASVRVLALASASAALAAVASSMVPHDAAAWTLFEVLGPAAVLFTLCRALSVLAPSAIRDRSAIGCAWHGAPDATVAQAFMLGGCVALADLAVASPVVGLPFADWPTAMGMLFAFGAIALAPVAEELVLRGVVFATARNLLGVGPSAAVAIAPTVLWAAAPIPGPRASPLTALILAGLAMALRLRHAALAPAIALGCGAAFTRCLFAALG